jgi:hypothetical protein
MSLKTEYPKRFLTTQVVEEQIVSESSVWKTSRGFSPIEAKIYESCLVIPLYSLEYQFLGYQLRNINDNNVDTKYSVTKTIYDPIVFTTNDKIEGVLVICEGTMDCLLLRLLGINACTLLGLKSHRVKRAFESITDQIIYIFDNDSVGKQFAKIYSSRGLNYIVPTQYKDINEFYLKDRDSFNIWISKLRKLTSF